MSGHHHHHGLDDAGTARLALAVAINLLLTVVQIVGGLLAGSLALVADALHNLSDAGALVIALIARRVALRPADRRRTFGYRRAETIGALINLTTLVIVGLYLIYEAVARYFDEPEIDGWIVVILAGVALVIDAGTALLTYRASRESVNIRAAFVHNVSDALASVGVMVAGTLILLYGWTEADLIAAFIVAGYVVYQGATMIGGTIRVLMESVPPDVAVDELVAAMEAVAGVQTVHHLHVWELDEHHRALEAHIVADVDDLAAMERIKGDLRALLTGDFEIGHCTLEFETPHAARLDREPHPTELIPPH